MVDISIVAAFVAGLFSITSPCILPVIPLYIAYLAGTAEADQRDPARVALTGVGFVIGFTLVFVVVGTAFGALGTALATRKTLLVQLGGLFLVAMGAQQIGLIRIPGLSRDRRPVPLTLRGGPLLSSVLVGVTFAAGWSPCAGPILGAIFTLALTEADASRATLLLTVYSAGLAIPFLAIALLGASSAILRRLAATTQSLTSLSGAVMLAVGCIMLLGWYQRFVARLVSVAPWSPFEPSL
ncbi:MAG: cytochrome c biogenesis protein CcdA [Actinomycetota bacterium]|nr:cytochrome c biogenesis protein CcdA [Actinomycetota bacterium]